MPSLRIASALGFAFVTSASAQTMPTVPTQPTLPQIQTLPTQRNELLRGTSQSQEGKIQDIQKRQFIERSNETSERTYREAPQTSGSIAAPSDPGSSSFGR
jgi:hypothetical protein